MLKGIDHINFACSDMKQTVRFWERLGVRLHLRLQLHDPERFHFFFDAGGGTLFSYWYWPQRELTPTPTYSQDHTGFYHLALRVDSEEELEEMRARVLAAGVRASVITGRHLFDKSFYFEDPDGIHFEFACRVVSLEGEIDHDGKGTLTPLSASARIERRRLDGPVHFETQHK